VQPGPLRTHPRRLRSLIAAAGEKPAQQQEDDERDDSDEPELDREDGQAQHDVDDHPRDEDRGDHSDDGPESPHPLSLVALTERLLPDDARPLTSGLDDDLRGELLFHAFDMADDADGASARAQLVEGAHRELEGFGVE